MAFNLPAAHRLQRPWLVLWNNRSLLFQLCARELRAKYKESLLGLTWALLLPLLMLAIYAFVFGEVFRARWGDSPAPQSWPERLNFALILYAGLMVFGWLGECLAKAPVSILSQTNFVKRVVFPLEILPLVPVLLGGFHFLMSFAVLTLFTLLSPISFSIHWLAIPIVLLPFLLCMMGLVWFLSALGVYFRDMEQIMPALTSALMFLSPVFYSVQALPEFVRPWLMMNPLTAVIEAVRNCLFWHQLPSSGNLLSAYLLSLLVFYAGFFCFSRLRKGFADVL